MAEHNIGLEAIDHWSCMDESRDVILANGNLKIAAKTWASLVTQNLQCKSDSWQVLDHAWVNEKWKHRMRDVQFDARANLRVSHAPIIAFSSLSPSERITPMECSMRRGKWDRSEVQEPNVRGAMKEKIRQNAVPKFEALVSNPKEGNATREEFDAAYEEFLLAGSSVPEERSVRLA